MTEECVKALDTFEAGKTPGNGGIPPEFYKTFWNSVGVFMTEVCNHSFELGQISSSQQQAVITLIDKKRQGSNVFGKLETNLLDSKIAIKVIANRIKNVPPGIIHSNKSGFMKGRLIRETARSILDIKRHGVLLFIDFEEAFDSKGWRMANARLRETARLAFFFASPRHFDFLDCETETSKCFECECETFRLSQNSSSRFG